MRNDSKKSRQIRLIHRNISLPLINEHLINQNKIEEINFKSQKSIKTYLRIRDNQDLPPGTNEGFNETTGRYL